MSVESSQKISPDELKRQLRAEALALGFEVCRVAPAVRAPHADAFHAWIGDGANGEMSWLAKDPSRRTQPGAVLPDARSVVVLGMNYWQRAAKNRGAKFARYAWGDDYHEIMESKLGKLDSLLVRHGGKQRSYVDTGPVLERDFAALAGVGWQGKSTMLIHPRFGTWLFLAVILTTLELALDEPIRDHCGKCTRCITACPTGAITAPHRVDARLCVSYLTIENKGSIPVPLRAAIGDRVYGCDDCLDACPWNRFAVESKEARFAAREFVGMSARELLALDEVRFREMFRKSPIKRIKRRGLLRNACVVLGNTGTLDDLPALLAAAKDEDSLIAEHAAWAVEKIRERAQISAANSLSD